MAFSNWRAVRTSPASRPALLAPWMATYLTADAGTLILRPRFPAWITTSAVMTLVTLPIGRLVPASRPHSFWPVPASARSAPSARTPAGAAADAAGPLLAGGAAGRALGLGALAGRALAGRALAGRALACKALAATAPLGTVTVDAALAGTAAMPTARTAPRRGGTARRAGSRMTRKVIT